MSKEHHYQQLVEIFDGCFADDFQTRLIKGDDEPIYLPADDTSPWHRVVLPMAFTPARCTKFRTGALPVKRGVSWWILVTGTARTARCANAGPV